MLPRIAERDLDWYVPRVDPQGPSMTDAISSIDTSALGRAGCSAFTYVLRSVQPFMRDRFDQFSETSLGGAFTFITGIGGFLQEFLYGYSGLRWGSAAVQLDPSLSNQLTGVTLHALHWQGRTFTVAIGPRTTRVSLQSGSALPVRIRGVTYRVTAGGPIVVRTRRPDQQPSGDLLRCRTVTASSAQPLGPALGAVDGSPATWWQGRTPRSTLTVDLGVGRRTSSASVLWGRRWAIQRTLGQPPPPSPPKILRATAYDIQVSADGSSWTTVYRARHRSTGRHDSLAWKATPARYLRIRILQSTYATPARLQDLTVTG
jgi:hypothetical protein